jgi:hypothetical protein
MEVPWVKLIWETYYDLDVPHAANDCGSYWWRDIYELMGNYRNVAKPMVKW